MRRWSKTALLVLALLLATLSPVQGTPAKKSFRIVLVPERNIFEQQRKYRALCDYICSQLPFTVKFEVLKGYRDVLHVLKDGEAEGAFMGSFVAAFGIENFGFVPLVRPVWPSGDSHYSSYVFKRAGLPITRDLATWKGRSFVFVSPHTSAGYFFPLALLKDYGVDEPAAFFSGIRFSGSHDAAVWMVANDMAEMGAAKNTVFEEYVKRKPELGEKIEILYTGGHYPDSTLLVRAGVSREAREAFRTVFLRMASHSEGMESLKMFGAMRFVTAEKEDYKDVRKVVEQSGHHLNDVSLMDD